MRKTVIAILISLDMVAVAIAARIDTVPLVPGGVQGSDKVPMGRPGTTTDYTASMDQIKGYVFGNNTSNPGVYAFNGRDGAVTPQAGDYTAAQVGADPSGTAAAAVATHNSVYNHLNIPTNQQIGAMTGTSGTPSTTNAFVTNADPRNSNARTPTAHAASHAANGSDPATLSTSQVQGLDTALAGKQATMSNAATLGKITESGNLPLWNNAPWPGGGGGGGDMYKATYDPQGKNGDAFSRANHTGTQAVTTITGLAPSATTDTTTTANITSSTDKRFVTDAQQSVLINTSGVNSGNVTLGTANGLSLTGQQLSLQLATNAQAGALSAADHTSYAQAASLAATAAQVSDSFTFKTTDTTLYGKAAGFDSTGVLGAAPDATSSAKGVVTVSGNTAIAASVSGTKTANKQLAFDASGNVVASSYDVGAAGGGGSGTVGSGTQYHLPFYSATGTTLADSGVTVSSNGTTLTTVQGTSPDALTLRPESANGTNGVTLLGPSGATTAYSLQFPTAAPTEGQIPVFGPPSGGTVPVTWGANSSGGTWGGITGTLANQTDLNTALGLKAPLASPTFTGSVTLPITGTGNQCVRVSATGVVSGTGSDCGSGSGSGSGTVSDSANAYRLAGYATTGTTVSDSGITYASDGSTITTAKIAANADALLLRAAPDTTGAGFMGPANSTTTPYYLQLSATKPTAGQVLVVGTPSTGTVNGVTADIIPVSGGTNGTSVTLTDSVSTTSSTTAASATAVKTAYDLAATKGTGTVTPSTTDVFTNKTLDTAGAGNVLKINGTQVTDKTGTGKVVLDTSPTLATPNIGAATATSVTATGPVSGTTSEIDGHSSMTLTAAQLANTTIYNTGQSAADVALTLPPAAAGMAASFTVGTAQTYKWGVRAGATDKIYILNADGTITAGSDNGYARMTNAQVGQMFACWTFKTDAYDWQCKQIAIGTSTFAAN